MVCIPVKSLGFPPIFQMAEFRVKMAIIGFLMFSCGSPVRAWCVEHKYNQILAVWDRGFELWLLSVQKNEISSIFSPTG